MQTNTALLCLALCADTFATAEATEAAKATWVVFGCHKTVKTHHQRQQFEHLGQL